MKAKIAVATTSGKAYFLIVNKLKEKNIDFISLIPNETVPTEIKAVITTQKEKHLIKHEKVLVYDSATEPDAVVNEAWKILQGKEAYEKVVIGVDPGEVFGLAVIADEGVVEKENCFSAQEVSSSVSSIVKNVDSPSTAVTIKIGNGVPTYKNLLDVLDCALPLKVVLEVVNESGTNRPLKNIKHRRGLRDIASAIRIAGRVGYIYPRRKKDASNG